ncbi:MAG: hypothetical protein E7218_04470 [Anaerofustis stercorihominis]|nr:hypothetical protein [Anaerofustis stercorihominis]
MSIRDKENQLFERLKESESVIIPDGIADETEYNSAQYRIIYVLKEVNGGKDWDLRSFINNGGRESTWDEIARWTEGILNINRDIPWAELDSDRETNAKRRKKYLPKIGAVNIKKTPGTHTSDMKEISRAAARYKDALIEQITLYDPDIIIACATGKACREVNYFYRREINDSDWKMTHKGIWYLDLEGKIFISFSHPEARIAGNYLYYTLIDSIKEIFSSREK